MREVSPPWVASVEGSKSLHAQFIGLPELVD